MLLVALRKESVDRNIKISLLLRPPKKSLSARRAWIEILCLRLMFWPFLPVALRKESVDRNFWCRFRRRLARVALRKESVDRNTGRPRPRPRTRPVALRKESVDRNADSFLAFPGVITSLSARRAWIEMAISSVLELIPLSVALRKESVDRNNGVHYDNYNLHCRSPQGERG